MITTTEWVWLGAIVVFTLTAIVFDLRWRRIPNWLTVSSLVLALVFHLATGGSWGLATAAAGFATGFGLLLVMWLIGGSGGGDVKLMGALGAWLGAQLTLYALVGSAVFVALGGVVVMMASFVAQGPLQFRRRHLSAVTGQPGKDPSQARTRPRLMPFALPLGLATWIIITWKVLSSHIHGTG